MIKKLAERREVYMREFAQIEELKVRWAEAGIKGRIVAGGSPTFPIYAREYDEVEASPGTFVFWDRGYQEKLPEQDLRPAGAVLTRGICTTGGGRYCLALGRTSIGGE